MPRRKTKTINLALQGGGAHGAFTWGVLDRLLEEEALAFEGITATSAGAMNAAAMKTGLSLPAHSKGLAISNAGRNAEFCTTWQLTHPAFQSLGQT